MFELRVSGEHCSGKTQRSLGRQIAVWSMRYASTFLIPRRGAEDIVFVPGKFWHRHRRPLPVEYNSDPEFHLGIKRDQELAKTVAKKKGGAAALRAQAAAAQAEGSVEPTTPRRGKNDTWVEVPSRSSVAPSAPVQDDERAISPISTTSSASEPPLAQRIRSNGVNHTPNSSSASAQAQGDVQEHVPEPSGPSTPLRHAPVS